MTTGLENIKQRISEYKTAPANERKYTGYASWVNWLADLEWAVTCIEDLTRESDGLALQLDALRRGYYPGDLPSAAHDAPAPTTDGAAFIGVQVVDAELMSGISNQAGCFDYLQKLDREKECSGGRTNHEWYLDGNHDNGTRFVCRQCGLGAWIAASAVPAPTTDAAPDEDNQHVIPVGTSLGVRVCANPHCFQPATEKVGAIYYCDKHAPVPAPRVPDAHPSGIHDMGLEDAIAETQKAQAFVNGTPAPVPTLDSAAAKVKLSKAQRDLIVAVKKGGVTTHHGSAREYALNELASLGLVYQGGRSHWYLTERGIAEYEAYNKR